MFTSFWRGRSPETSALPRPNDSASAGERGRTKYLRRGEKERTKNATFSSPVGSRSDGTISDSGSLAPILGVETLQGTRPPPMGMDATPEKKDKQQQQRRMRTPRSPRSASAVKDGRKYLLAYRQQRGRERAFTPPGSAPVKGNTQGGSSTARSDAGPGGIESLSVPPGLTAALSERIERYQTCAPGLARSLETALNASLHGSSNRQSAAADEVVETDKVTGLHYREETGLSGSDRGMKGRVEELSREGDEVDGGSSPTARPSPRTASSSPERRAQTPQTLRQAARTSQADFLSTVLSETAQDTVNSGDSSPRAGLVNDRRTSTAAAKASPKHRGNSSLGNGATSETGGLSSSGGVAAAADETAMRQWASLQRLQNQNLGLGTAAKHQLGRALELCRDLQGIKGGSLGHERTSRLDALQSALYGLEEVLTKQRTVDKAARKETRALGGPTDIGALLDSNSEHDKGVPAGLVAGDGTGGTGEGWVTGAQLKAFEKQIRSRSTLEIAALESERRKLKEKVEMFQRQVQFLQRESVDRPRLPGANAAGSGDGAVGGRFGDGDGSRGGRLKSAESPGFASLFDARLGDDRYLQATLEAEVNSLRGSLEEKDGLIDALRQALRAAAITRQTATGNRTRRLSEPPPAADVASMEQLSISRDRLQNRSRSSRLLQAPGPVATSKAVAVADAAAASARGRSGRRGEGGEGRIIVSVNEYGAREEGSFNSPIGGLDVGGTRAVMDSGDVVAPAAYSSSRIEGRGEEALVALSTSHDEMKCVEGDSEYNIFANGAFSAPSGADEEASATAVREPIALSASSGKPTKGGERKEEAARIGNGDNGGRGRVGVVSMATSAPGVAWRAVWGSARAVGATVGIGGGASPQKEKPRMPRHRGGSSHAVLIF